VNSDPDLEDILVDLRFKESVFFDLILPLIIFPSGFNMRRKKFFNNISTILKFGFIGTLICFTYYTALTYGASKAGLLRRTLDPPGPNGETSEPIPI
jgi:NhaP-type Na+/H+ or K+/H+ antiporter